MRVNYSSMITHVHVRVEQGYIPSGTRPADTELIYSTWSAGECWDYSPPLIVGDFPEEDGCSGIVRLATH